MIIIGEKLNSSIPRIHEAIEKKDAARIRELARQQQQAGADFLDINAGMFVENESENLIWLMETAREASSLPFVIDSPSPAVAAAAAARYTGEKPIINSITLEKGRYEDMLSAAQKYNTGLVALCMDDTGVPDGVERRIELANTLVEKLTAEGIAREDIYLDPMVRPAGSGEGYGLEAVKAIRGIRETLPDVHIVCGLSNISFGLPARELLNSTFLAMAAGAGLSCCIGNPGVSRMAETLASVNALLGRDENAEFLMSR